MPMQSTRRSLWLGRHLAALLVATLAGLPAAAAGPEIPLPEHPRPDFARAAWQNLNGPWSFRFDKDKAGEREGWMNAAPATFPLSINVPFPWGSKLSGVADEAPIAWYARSIRVPSEWQGQRVFLVVGAADWETAAWLDGQPLGRHQGGYTPFELELTPHVTFGREQRLVLRVDDVPRDFKLEGKQGYGNARGIWQTVYLEARPSVHITALQLRPDIVKGQIDVRLAFSGPVLKGASVAVELKSAAAASSPRPVTLQAGAREARLVVPVANPHLWSLEDPFLYEADVVLRAGGNDQTSAADRVSTYFGLRSIGVTKLPGTSHTYVALNGRPVYLQMALDQAYHPDGFYTFPSDAFVRDELLRARRLGLNALREHVKIESPRKLYWADRLGVLIMADVPNSWGAPDADMRRDTEVALRGMLARDFNHPAVFAWVLFNETWGLQNKDPQKTYAPETQTWVESMWRLAKSLEPTRLVEDNSPCNLDHVVTDLNTWHTYLPGYAWREHLEQVTRDTFPGSSWNFIGGRTQGEQPLVNSECGNVWGYEGSTGDVDWSFDYHAMLDELRRHPKIGGWLYTELHDVVNEWNGYYRFDRSEKETGLSELLPGMTLSDLHAPLYLAVGDGLCPAAAAGAHLRVPLFASFLTDRAPAAELTLRATLVGWDALGVERTYGTQTRTVRFEPWMARALEPLDVTLPGARALCLLRVTLETPTGAVVARNFAAFDVGGEDATPRDETLEVAGHRARILRVAPSTYTDGQWTLGHWQVLDGLKVNGAGAGFFEYRLSWPAGLDPTSVAGVHFRAELGAKQLLTKDREHAPQQEGDFMRGAGTADPSLNPNSYPMTDGTRFPSAVRIRLNGVAAGVFDLPDDPADHRGLLSWHAQPRDRRLREAGSYGYLVDATLPAEAVAAAAQTGMLVLRLEVDPTLAGGLAVYGERFGRYPLDPSIVFELR